MFTRFATKSGGALLLSLMLTAAACGSGASTTASPASTASSSAPAVAVSSTTNPALGTLLTDANQMTLYFFDNDKPIKPQSSCSGGCEKVWPLVLATDAHAVGTGVDASKLGQVTRADGRVQLTYNSWPLYRYSGDTTPGQTNGQGIMGIWHVAGVDGKPVLTTPAPQAAAPTTNGY